MERKHFLRASLCLGAVCGLRPVLGAEEKPSPASAPENPCAGAMGYARHWVKDLIDQADAQLTEPQRKALLEARGRSCAKAGAAQRAAPFRGRLDAFLADLQAHMGKDAAQRAGDVVEVTYPRCFCPLVSDFQEPLSASYCFCSAGWLKEVYETVSGRPVTVEIVETVKRGGQRCRFHVKLNA
jgi:predicted hydrocarbon binding protein